MAIRKWIIERFRGMRRVDDVTVNLSPEYCNTLANYYVNDNAYMMRTGSVKMNPTALNGAVLSMKEIQIDDGTKRIIVEAGSKWYDCSTAIATQTAIFSGITDKAIDMSQFDISSKAYAIIANGADEVKKYDGTTLSSLGTIVNDINILSNTNASGANATSCVVDNAALYLYIANTGATSAITKVRTSDMVTVGTLTLTGTNAQVSATAIDSLDNYMYVGTLTSPAQIIRINLSTFAVSAINTLLTAGNCRAMVIDSTDANIYAACGGAATHAVKLSLTGTFATAVPIIKTLTKLTVSDMVIDHTDTFLYISHFISPGYITKLSLTDFTTEATLAGAAFMTSLAIDSTSTFLYAGDGQGSAGRTLYKIALSTFTVSTGITLTDTIGSLAMDEGDDFLYVLGINEAAPTMIETIKLSDFTFFARRESSNNLLQSTAIKSPIFIRSKYAYIVYYSNPVYVQKILLDSVPKFLETHQHKLWAFGFDTDVYRMYAFYSATDACTDWTTANDAGYLNFGNIIKIYDTPTGMRSFAQSLMAFFFKENILIYHVGTDPDEFALVQHIRGTGSLSNNIVQVGNDLWFPTKFGLRSLRSSMANEDLNVNNVSDAIDNFWSDNIAISDTNLDRIHMVYDKIRNLMLITSNDLVNQEVMMYVFSISDKAWSYFKNANLEAGAVNITSCMSTQDGIVYFGTSAGYIYQLYSGTTDDGTAIDYWIEPVVMYFGDPSAHKKIKMIEVVVDGD